MAHNTSPREVKKFSARAAEWWDPRGAFRTLHDINPVRLAFIQAQRPLDGLRVLDVGAGGGILAEAMARQGARVTGIDASEENIAAAAAHAGDNGLAIDYRAETAERHAENHAGRYDLITCMELLEHVPDPASVIRASAVMGKAGAHVMFATINRTLKAYLLGVIAAEYLLKLLPRGTHHYGDFIRPSELVRWCHAAGLRLNRLNGLRYNPFLNHCALDNRPDVNYLLDTVVGQA